MKILQIILVILVWTLVIVWAKNAQGDIENEPRVPMAYSEAYVGPQASLTLSSPKDYLLYLSGNDYNLLNRVINCESGWNPLVKNKSSTASGLMQFLDSTWSKWGEGDVFDPIANIKAGVRLFKAEGTAPWLASKDCWSVDK